MIILHGLTNGAATLQQLDDILYEKNAHMFIYSIITPSEVKVAFWPTAKSKSLSHKL
jgi:hypothetical protein